MSLPERFRKRARQVGAGLAAAGIAGLAGCASGSDDEAPSTPTGEPTSTPDASTDAAETPTATEAPQTPTPTVPPRSATPTAISAECNEKVAELDAKLNEVQMELSEVNFLLSEQRQNERALEMFVEQLRDGFSESTMQRARTVGLAVRDSVVVVEGYRDGRSAGTGTGWFVGDGRIVTNAHVVDNHQRPVDSATCYLPDGTSFEASVAGYVEGHQPDVALLETDYTDAPALSFGSDADLEEGQPLVQVGHPGTMGNWITCLGKFVAREKVLLADSSYHDVRTVVQGLQGVSGSPVVDLDGNVVATTWGGGPVFRRQPDEAPAVAPDVVYDVSLSPIGISQHVGAATVREEVAKW